MVSLVGWVLSSLEMTHGALVPELQGLDPQVQPSPLSLWTVELGFSLGALSTSGKREPGSGLLGE